MNQASSLHDRAQAVVARFNAPLTPRIQQLLDAEGVAFGRLPDLQMAQSAEPEPLTLDLLAARSPYMAPERIAADLAAAVEDGLLAPVPGGYGLTERGRHLGERAMAIVAEGTARSTGETTADRLEQIDALLRRLVDDCEGVVDHDLTCLRVSRAFEPGADAPVATRIRRHLVDLMAFRDDAHIAAWRPLGLPGHAWEAFSHVWGEGIWGDAAPTIEALEAKLGFRGYTADDYREALALVEARGWIAERDGTFSLTDEGRRVREAAEADTDRRYAAPWSLSGEALAELDALLVELEGALSTQAEAANEA